MKANKLKKCALCDRGMMHANSITFFRIKIERLVVDFQAVQRMAGMEQFFGGEVGIARVFSDEDIAKPLPDDRTILICEPCSMGQIADVDNDSSVANVMHTMFWADDTTA